MEHFVGRIVHFSSNAVNPTQKKTHKDTKSCFEAGLTPYFTKNETIMAVTTIILIVPVVGVPLLGSCLLLNSSTSFSSSSVG